MALQAPLDEQIDQSFGHVDDILNRLLGCIIAGKNVEFLYKLFFDRLTYELGQGVCRAVISIYEYQIAFASATVMLPISSSC